MLQIEGIFEKINRMQNTLDEINLRIQALANDTQNNFGIFEERLGQKMVMLKEELRAELTDAYRKD